jgi:prepilin-type N-terminal cleavage/methylation domain-containing protein
MGEQIKTKSGEGFTLIELLVVIVVIGILAALTNSFVLPNYRERTYYSTSISDMNTLANAVSLYVAKYNAYPDDVSRGIPSSLDEFLQTNGHNGQWPAIGPWPNSIWDWDNWSPDPVNGPLQTYQLSIRFCQTSDPLSVCKQNFPKESWVTSSWDQYSSVYFCISGSCRSHQDYPSSHPGYCINCGSAGDTFKG